MNKMTILNRKIWQYACGKPENNFAGICLEWDVILYGPGQPGPFLDSDRVYEKAGVGVRRRNEIRLFAEHILEGDIVVLIIGTTDVMGVGEVVGPYEWNDKFSHTNGWDLQHVRRVRWLWKADENPRVFETYTFKPGAWIQELSAEPALNWLNGLEINSDLVNTTVNDLSLFPRQT